MRGLFGYYSEDEGVLDKDKLNRAVPFVFSRGKQNPQDPLEAGETSAGDTWKKILPSGIVNKWFKSGTFESSSLVGSKLPEREVTLYMEFIGLGTVNGQECAVISVRVNETFEDSQSRTVISGKGKFYKSLDTGVYMKGNFELDVSHNGSGTVSGSIDESFETEILPSKPAEPKPAEPKPAFITKGLIAYYPFNGNAKDASGKGHDGKATKVEFVEGGFGADDKAGKFAGSGSRITVDAHDFPSGKSPRTLSCFVKVTGANPGTENFSLGYGTTSNNRAFGLFADGFDSPPSPNGMFAWSQWGQSVGFGFTKENEAKRNQWYMLTAAYDGKTVKTYLNGASSRFQALHATNHHGHLLHRPMGFPPLHHRPDR